MSDRNIRLRIEAVSELPTVADQLQQLITLTKQHEETTRQAALSARTGSLQEIDAIQGITQALKEQQNQQKKTSDDTASGLKGINDQFATLSSGVKSFTGLIATAFAISEIKQFGESIIDAKTSIDSVKISLETMLGSKKEASELYAQIVDLASKTPFTLQEVSEQVVKLKAYNIETADLIPTITSLGNIAAAVGKEKLPQLTLAYGQVANAGRLMGTELKQFVEAGVPILDLIAKSYDKTKEAVIDMAAKHEISFGMVRKAILDASAEGGKYQDLMTKLSTTVGGQASNLSDAWQIAQGRIGDFFETTIKSGTVALQNLVTATAGSNSAIERTIDIVKSAAAFMATLTLATKGQAAVDAIITTYQATKNILYGEYLLAMRAVTAQQVVFTAAETEAVVAAEAFNVALSANWVGIAATAIGGLVTAYYAYSAATDEVTTKLGEEEAKLKTEESQLNIVAEAALNASEGSKQRKEYIELLIQKYPEYFSGLKAEKTSNEQLKSILDAVNDSYEKRIAMAREAYKTEGIVAAQKDLFEKEQAFFESLAKLNNDHTLEIQFGGSVQKLVDALDSGGASAEKLKQKLNESASGGAEFFGAAARNIASQFDSLEKQSSESALRTKKIGDEARSAEIQEIQAHYEALRQQADGNSKKIAQINADEKTAIAKANGTYRETEIKDTTDHAAKMKSITLLSANEIAVIKGENEELSLKQQLDFLDKQEKAEIDAINKQKVNAKISADALAALKEQARQKIAAIDAEYDAKRQVIQDQIEQETQTKFLEKTQETNDKVKILVNQRLEAERTLTLLNDARTNDERLLALKQYNDTFNLNLKQESVEQLKIQAQASAEALANVEVETGKKGDAYRAAYAAWLKDNLQYETALTNQTVAAAKETAQQIQEYEKQIQEAKQKTAQVEKDTEEIQKKSREAFVTNFLQVFGQIDGIIGQFAQTLSAAFLGFDQLDQKALGVAEKNLANAKTTLDGIRMIYSDGTAEGAAAIAQAETKVAESKQKLETTKAESLAGVANMFTAAYQVASTIASAINGLISESWQAVADGLGRAREAYKYYYDYVIKESQDAYQKEMQAFTGSLDERLRKITEYYDKEKEFARGQDTIDATLAFNQQIATLYAKSGQSAKDLINGIMEAEANQQKQHYESQIRQANFDIQQATDVRDAKIAAIDAALQAAKDAEHEAEQVIQNESDAKKKGLEDQLDSVRKSYADQIAAVNTAYETQLSALRDKESQERAEIQATYDLKQSLLEQSTSDTIEEVAIVDRVRLEALGRYEDGERSRIIATRDRILATLTDEGERATVTAFYENQLKDLHTTVENAKLDKSLGIQLATKQLNKELKDDTVNLKTEEKTDLDKLADDYQTKYKNLAAERDKTVQDLKDSQTKAENTLHDEITKLENDTAAKITKLQNDLKNQETKSVNDKIAANEVYANAVLQANQEIFNAVKAEKIVELQAEIAILQSKRNIFNKGAIDDAIQTLNQAIAAIAGIQFSSAAVVLPRRLGNSSNGLQDQIGILTPNNPVNRVTGQDISEAYDSGGRKIELKYDPTGHSFSAFDKDKNPLEVAYATGFEPVTGRTYFQGADYVELGNNPKGKDTVPAMVNEGERIIPTVLNEALGGRSLSNEELVNRVLGFNELTKLFPGLNLMPLSAGSPFRLPDGIMNSTGGSTIDITGLQHSLKRVERAIENKKLLSLNVDQNGFSMGLIGKQSKVTYYSNLLQQ